MYSREYNREKIDYHRLPVRIPQITRKYRRLPETTIENTKHYQKFPDTTNGNIKDYQRFPNTTKDYRRLPVRLPESNHCSVNQITAKVTPLLLFIYYITSLDIIGEICLFGNDKSFTWSYSDITALYRTMSKD